MVKGKIKLLFFNYSLMVRLDTSYIDLIALALALAMARASTVVLYLFFL